MANSFQDALNKFIDFFKGLGKSPDRTVLRAGSGAESRAASASGSASGPAAASSTDSVSGAASGAPAETSGVSRVSNSRLPTLDNQTPKSKDQWNKIKKSAKESEPASGSVEHWAQKSAAGGILSGTTFDAATTEVGNGPRAHKRPTMVTQARITHGRLQALQAQIEKPKNEFDKAHEDDEEQDYRGGH